MNCQFTIFIILHAFKIVLKRKEEIICEKKDNNLIFGTTKLNNLYYVCICKEV